MHIKTDPAIEPVLSDAPASCTLTSDRLVRLTIALLTLLLIYVLVFPMRAAGDIALYADVGGRVLDGQRPYTDFFDINPPTIHFLNVPSVALSRLTGLHSILTFHLFIWLLVAGTVIGAGLIFVRAQRAGLSGQLPMWLIPASIALGSLFGWMRISFGQRDHIFILALLLWAILRWYRWEGGRPWAWGALLVGVIGAVGASLKPTFVLGFALVEVYGLLRYRNWRAFFTWEILGAGIVIGWYGVYFVLQPDILRIYLTEVAPSVVAGYRSYGYKSVSVLLFGEPQSILAVLLAGLMAGWGIGLRSSKGRLYILLALLTVACVLSFVLQTKGWDYHSLPMLMMIIILAGLLFERALALPTLKVFVRRYKIANAYPAITVAIVALGGLVMAMAYVDGEGTTEAQEPFLRYSQPGDSVIIADISVIPNYPSVIQTNRRPVSRYPMAYPLGFAYANLDALPDDVYTPEHRPPLLAQTYLDVLVEDLSVQKPELFLMRANVRVGYPTYVNVARYVKAHTDVMALLDRDYDRQEDLAGYEVYVRKPGH
ncbi:MAG: hypothetical protein IT320_04570 [Anaerolineae bacterium]|nr:hypothetical protein [Anaerolineae bacterium]